MKGSDSTYSSSQLKEILQKAHQNYDRSSSMGVLYQALLILIPWLCVLILAEHAFYLSVGLKFISLSGALLTTLFVFWNGYSNKKSISFIEFYRGFARSSKVPALTYALDLEKNSNANPKLVEAAIFKNLEQIDGALLTEKLDQFLSQSDRIRSTRRKMFLSIGVLIAFAFTSFSFDSASKRLGAFWEDFEKPNPFAFIVTPGTTTIEQGTPFSVQVEFDGETPREVVLYMKTPIEENFRGRDMQANSQNYYSSTPFDLSNDLEYYIEMDGYKSGSYSIDVQLRPRFSELNLTVVPPSYTGIDSTSYFYPFSNIQAYQGSELVLSGLMNKPVLTFILNRKNQLDSLSAPENIFEHSVTVLENDTLSFTLEDNNGLSNSNNFEFVVQAIQDEYPYIELLEPSASFEAVEPTTIEILFRANDDFDLTKATLNYELVKAFVNSPYEVTTELETPRNGALQSFLWDITDLNLSPKDELSFWIEVTDNDGFNGYKSTRSQEITLTVPSLVDYFEGLEERESEVETDLEDISKAFQEMSDQYDTFKEQLKEDPQVNYEDQRQIEEVIEQQEEIQERIEELNEKFDELKEELSEKNMLSEETLSAYEELKKLMEEIDDPAFREALEKLQQQMSEMTPDQMRDALQQAEFNEELYRQRLERTLELFKNLKLQSDLEKLAESYEDMARQEEELEQDQLSPEMEKQQKEEAIRELEQLYDQLMKLSENMTSKTEQPVQELQEKSAEELQEIEDTIRKMMEDLEKALEEGITDSNRQSIEQQRQQIQEMFSQMAQETRNTINQIQQEQQQLNIAGLNYILYGLLNLSIEQEDLVSYASTTENRSQAFVEHARNQKNVEDIFISLSDSLFELSKEVPQISNTILQKKEETELRLSGSLEQMAERSQNRASVASRQALGGINDLAFLIANILEQESNSQGGGSGSGQPSMPQMIEQMQQMGQDQQQLNQQLQEMINDMQGERLTQDQMDRLNQISRQQNEIRKQLQQLQRSGQLEGGDKLGSEIERMIEEMEDTINDLRGGAVDPTLIERQQNILSRMLEAENALQERDEEEKREGNAAENLAPTTPPELTLEELEKQIRNRLNDPNFTKYSPDYQRLIEKYFELLKLIQEREIQ
ncbi:MAG: hypothetical protein ED557_04505 [Balneola sp.]|nr:MAG: hypothetical protein ED557_04505 [Balneola sp.]